MLIDLQSQYSRVVRIFGHEPSDRKPLQEPGQERLIRMKHFCRSHPADLGKWEKLNCRVKRSLERLHIAFGAEAKLRVSSVTAKYSALSPASWNRWALRRMTAPQKICSRTPLPPWIQPIRTPLDSSFFDASHHVCLRKPSLQPGSARCGVHPVYDMSVQGRSPCDEITTRISSI